MTARTWLFRGETSRSDSRSPDVADEASAKLLAAAFAAGGLAAVLLTLGALLPVVHGGSRGYASGPLLVALALLPMVLAAAFVLTRRPLVAAGVLAGFGALAPGRIVLDLQFLVDPSLTAHPELYRPVSLAWPGPGPGLWLALAGQAALGVAGLLAARLLARQVDLRGSAAPSGVGGRRWLAGTVLAGLVAGVGLVMAPYRSGDAFLPAWNAFEGPLLVLGGCLLLACALPLAGAFAMGSGAGEVAGGCLFGLAGGVAAVAVPNLVSGLAVQSARPSAGPIVALLGAAILVVLAFAPAGPRTVDESGEANLPGKRGLRVATGLFGMFTAFLAVSGALVPQIVKPDGTTGGAESPARFLLLTAGLLVGVLGLAMLVPSLAARIRPVLSVCWIGVPLAGTAVVDTALASTEVFGTYSVGSGMVWTSLAMFAAATTACCSVIAGMVERDESEDADADGPRPGPGLLVPLVLGGLLAVGAFGLPATGAPAYTGASLFGRFDTPSWGLLAGLLVVLGAAFLAPRSRPPRAAALLFGAACVAGLRIAEPWLLGSPLVGAHVALGWWFALGSAAALVVAAVLAVSRPVRRAV
ncbi:hypothetical protein [Amycolatopsis anabasis]|uniref:hypothetical protein n=1 Tax=Amycolatopsis anabasis TaxID=1840409 RepID=UPI00131C7DEF|nr:hypothetical protein [Amycolatopsis anabasis]